MLLRRSSPRLKLPVLTDCPARHGRQEFGPQLNPPFSVKLSPLMVKRPPVTLRLVAVALVVEKGSARGPGGKRAQGGGARSGENLGGVWIIFLLRRFGGGGGTT